MSRGPGHEQIEIISTSNLTDHAAAQGPQTDDSTSLYSPL